MVASNICHWPLYLPLQDLSTQDIALSLTPRLARRNHFHIRPPLSSTFEGRGLSSRHSCLMLMSSRGLSSISHLSFHSHEPYDLPMTRHLHVPANATCECPMHDQIERNVLLRPMNLRYHSTTSPPWLGNQHGWRPFAKETQDGQWSYDCRRYSSDQLDSTAFCWT
jgi:hypothetical protein